MNSVFVYRHKLLLTSALSSALLIAGAAAAQSAPPAQPNSEADQSSNTNVGQVVVTAQKRAQLLKDVPMSVAVVSSKDLQQMQVHDLNDLQMVVPGLNIEHARGTERISIDGVANQFGGASAIGAYVNEASATVGAGNALNIATMDLARVEALRGPQGTLYGQGSLGGTIRFITRAPDLNNYQFIADTGAEAIMGGSPSEFIEPVVNIPLIPGQLALRVAGSFHHDGGWVDDPSQSLKNINYSDRADVRSELLWQPNDKLRVEAMVIDHRATQTLDEGMDNANTYQPIPPINAPLYGTDNYDLYNLDASYDFGFATLHSSTTYYNYYDNGPFEEVNPVNGPLTGPGAVPADQIVLNPLISTFHDISEEVRLTSDPGSPLVWDVGYFYERQRSFSNYVNYYLGHAPADFGGPIVYTPAAGIPEILFDYFTNTVLESNSFFGNVSYKFFDRLTLGVGLRYYGDVQHTVNGFDDLSAYNGIQTRHDHSLDPRFDADFKVTDYLNLYGSVAKGFRSGGFNGSAGLPGISLPGFTPEEVWRYEIGLKGSTPDGHFSGEVSGFYSTYSNYIVLGVVNAPVLGPTDLFTNGGNVRLDGVEWDLNWAPTKDWLVKFSGEYVDTAFTKVIANTEHLVGEPVDEVSPLVMNAAVTRNFEVYGKPAYIMANVESRAPETYINHEAAGENAAGQPIPSPWYHYKSSQITVLNLRANLEVNEHLSVGIFANNVTNDRGALQPLSFLRAVAYEQPTSFGLDAHINY